MDKHLSTTKLKRIRRWIRTSLVIIASVGVASIYQYGSSGRTEPFSLAPHPEEYKDAVVQVYAARTRGIKKIFAEHTWVAVKPRGADHYIKTQVIGWRLRRRGTSVYSEPGIPDRDWYGNAPGLLLDVRGEQAEIIIKKLDSAISVYPWAGQYRAWPGPNSNTFTAWLGLTIPEMGLDLPSTAIGKDWRPMRRAFGRSTSGTGLQASIIGLVGVSVGMEEGIEVNLLGLSFEIDLLDLAIELPGVGRVGWPAVQPEEKD